MQAMDEEHYSLVDQASFKAGNPHHGHHDQLLPSAEHSFTVLSYLVNH